MRLFFFSNRISDPQTGGELYNYALIEGAERAGFQVIRCEAVSLKFLKHNLLFCNIWYLAKVLFSKKQDLFIIDTDLHARCFFSVIIGKIVLHRKFIGMLHHYNYWDKEIKLISNIHLFLERLVSSYFSFLITNSKFSLLNFVQLTGKSIPHKILTPFLTFCNEVNAIHVTDMPLKKCIHFLHVGSIERRKNLHNTIRALSEIGIDYHFDIIGKFVSPSYRQMLQALVSNLSAQSKITFHGFISESKIRSFFDNADVFILVSLMEGYGMVYAEAISHGLPIIASNCGAIPELVIDGVNGILCDAEDVGSIKAAILKIIDEKNRNEIRINNFSKANSFLNRENFVIKAKNLFNNLQQYYSSE